MIPLRDIRVGLRVRVAKIADECGNRNAIGCVGRIASVDVDDFGSPEWPYITVRLDKPIRFESATTSGGALWDRTHSHHFWREELVRLNPKRRRSA